MNNDLHRVILKGYIDSPTFNVNSPSSQSQDAGDMSFLANGLFGANLDSTLRKRLSMSSSILSSFSNTPDIPLDTSIASNSSESAGDKSFRDNSLFGDNLDSSPRKRLSMSSSISSSFYNSPDVILDTSIASNSSKTCGTKRTFSELVSSENAGDKSYRANGLFGNNLDSTPRKRLSMSSSISSSFSNTPDLHLDTSIASNSSKTCGIKRTFSELISSENAMSPDQFCPSPRNKENIPTPYYSPRMEISFRHAIPRLIPLRELQNTVVNRNLEFSPLKMVRKDQLSPVKIPTPPDDCDSKDSGYASCGKVETLSPQVLPTRKLNLDMSPRICAVQSPLASVGPNNSFESLLSAPILCNPIVSPKLDTPSPRIRRSLSWSSPENSSHNKETVSPPETLQQNTSFKRPISPDQRQNSSKRSRKSPLPLSFQENGLNSALATVFSKNNTINITPKTFDVHLNWPRPLISVENQPNSSPWIPKPILQPFRHISEPDVKERPPLHRSHSESHLTIMKALNKSSNNSLDLTGDYSQPLSLPVIQGKHPDLITISIHTLAELMRGEHSDKIASVKLIDCRYPYEYNGGHLKEAENWYHPKMINDFLYSQNKPPVFPESGSQRHVIVFHCEFSAERGPKAQRWFRELDRTINKEHYPALYYPELYLLDGGYKAFYEVYNYLCTPMDYIKMLDERHSEDFKLLRSKIKSWNAKNNKGKTRSRTASKRIGMRENL